jgi:hypothetical protein
MAAQGFTGDELELMAGQATLGTMVLFPLILVILFTGLFIFMRKRKTGEAHSDVDMASA